MTLYSLYSVLRFIQKREKPFSLTYTYVWHSYIHGTSPEGNIRNWLIRLTLKWKIVELGTRGSEWKLNILYISSEHLESLLEAYSLSKIKTIKNTIKMWQDCLYKSSPSNSQLPRISRWPRRTKRHEQNPPSRPTTALFLPLLHV